MNAPRRPAVAVAAALDTSQAVSVHLRVRDGRRTAETVSTAGRSRRESGAVPASESDDRAGAPLRG